MCAHVVVKLGGGLITHKDKICTVNPPVLDNICQKIALLSSNGINFVIVHGAGSFGHIKAKEWKLHLGRTNLGGVRRGEINSQNEAVISVREDMNSLNKFVTSTFEKSGMECRVHPPREWATETGQEFKGTLPEFSTDPNIIDITFGDVVDCAEPKQFGILSGDDICYRIVKEVDVSHMVFGMSGADGLMTLPPDMAGSELIPIWQKGMAFDGAHNEKIDVTGGIHLKIKRAEQMAQFANHIWIINGAKPQRLGELITTGNTIGTRIIM